MASTARSSTSYNTRVSTSYSVTNSTSYQYGDSASLRLPRARRSNVSRTGSRPGTRRSIHSGTSVIGGSESQQIICAVSEGRGISPTVGLAFVNISTGEAVLSQICDNQFYARTVNKLHVFEPTRILMITPIGTSNRNSKMSAIILEEMIGSKIINLDRKYWSEVTGPDYINQLAFLEDVDALKVAIGGNYFATCCFSAALKYIDLSMSLTFAFHSLRIRYQPSEGTMMIDLSTIQALELIQNIQDSKSSDCLFGLLNKTLTPMGSRFLRSNILQPATVPDLLVSRYDAVEELQSKEEMFFATRQALKPFLDVDRLLTNLILYPTRPDIQYSEQSINNVLILKTFVLAIAPLHDALVNARSTLLLKIKELCRPEKIGKTIQLIESVINPDVTYQKTPLDLQNQRTYAVKSGVNGLLDVARQTYKEATEDVHQHVTRINNDHEMQADIRYDNRRRYYLRVPESDLDHQIVPNILINQFRKKGFIECQTLHLVKLNQRIEDSHQEVILMSDKAIQELLEEVRGEIPALFKVCEGIALLDMIAAFSHLVTLHDYCRPELTDCLAVSGARHPIREAHNVNFVPNNVYATQQTRFQVITGCNMSGKSTYIQSVALMCIMVQIGSFVPARSAYFPVFHQLFARISMDNSVEANVSTFAAEMRETAFILRNVDRKSLAVIDELGRGTSTRDGLAIALAIAEALVDSHAFIWFATHFKELAQILQDRPGVINHHLTVDMGDANKLTMLYKLVDGYVTEEHYGLALARAVNLPLQVTDVAEKVSTSLEARAAAKKRSSRAAALFKRRKVVLALREQLKQARDSPMEGQVLASWLRQLQETFVRRMEQIGAEAYRTGEEESSYKELIDDKEAMEDIQG